MKKYFKQIKNWLFLCFRTTWLATGDAADPEGDLDEEGGHVAAEAATVCKPAGEGPAATAGTPTSLS